MAAAKTNGNTVYSTKNEYFSSMDLSNKILWMSNL